MMHGCEKSDPAIVALKPPNDAGLPVEEGGGAKGGIARAIAASSVRRRPSGNTAMPARISAWHIAAVNSDAAGCARIHAASASAGRGFIVSDST